jgi:hypothetical protein
MSFITIKPVRPTNLQFNSAKEYQDFVRYASSTEKTDSAVMNSIRKEIINHKRSPRRK